MNVKALLRFAAINDRGLSDIFAMKHTKQTNGFTLIELMIVMIILGILAVIGISAFISSQIKGRDSHRKGDLKTIAQGLELYYNDKGQYPTDDGAGGLKGCWTVGGNTPADCTANQVWQDTNGTIYAPAFPADPVANQKYYYVSSNGKQFQLYARLENSQDPQITSVSTNGFCGASLTCNYGVSSGNIGL